MTSGKIIPKFYKSDLFFSDFLRPCVISVFCLDRFIKVEVHVSGFALTPASSNLFFLINAHECDKLVSTFASYECSKKT